MSTTTPQQRLTHAAALTALQAAIAKADEIGVPQCIAVCDEGGNLLAFVRMDGARFLSIGTAQRKAATAASSRAPTGGREAHHALELALVTGGRLTNLRGGVPIVVDQQVVGGVGVSSGNGDQDVAVAQAGAEAVAL